MEICSDSLTCVFNALDTDKRGRITVDQFTSAFEQFYNSCLQQSQNDLTSYISPPTLDVKKIVESLDPQHDGFISFEDFQSAFRNYFSCDTDDIKKKPLFLHINNKEYPFASDDCMISGTQDFETDNKTEDSGIHSSHYDVEGPEEYSSNTSPCAFMRTNGRRRLTNCGRSATCYPMGMDEADSPLSENRYNFTDVTDGSFVSLQKQMRLMQEHVKNISTNQHTEQETMSKRLRDENARLSALTFVLDERLKEAEARFERCRETEHSHTQSLLARAQRTHDSEIDGLHSRIQKLESDLSEHSMMLCRMKMEVEMAKSEKTRALESLSETEEQVKMLQTKLTCFSTQGANELAKVIAERDSALMSLNSMQSTLSKGGEDRNLYSANGADTSSRFEELHQIIRTLKLENKKLSVELSEAQDDLISHCIQEGKSLLKTSENSLASEFNTLSKNEISDLLMAERHVNSRLRDYIQCLTEKIILRSPEILQI